MYVVKNVGRYSCIQVSGSFWAPKNYLYKIGPIKGMTYAAENICVALNGMVQVQLFKSF
jgi:hypothetical protein